MAGLLVFCCSIVKMCGDDEASGGARFEAGAIALAACPSPLATPAAGDVYAAAAAAVGTDFRQWSEAEVRAFLEQRGEDYDDCQDFAALVRDAGLALVVASLASTVWLEQRGYDYGDCPAFESLVRTTGVADCARLASCVPGYRLRPCCRVCRRACHRLRAAPHAPAGQAGARV